jgi:hypothetical protein
MDWPILGQLISILIALVLIVFWFWMFRDMANNDYLPGNTKNTWFIAFVLLSIFAAFWYYFVEYRNRNL